MFHVGELNGRMLCALTAEMRRELVDLRESGQVHFIRIEGDGLRMDYQGNGGSADGMQRAVQHIDALIRRLEVPEAEVFERLAAMADSDTAPGVRRRAADALLEEFDQERAARALIESGDLTIRILGAEHLWHDGVELLTRLARDSSTQIEHRRSAVAAMARLASMDGPEAGVLRTWCVETMRELVRDPNPGMRKAVVAALASLGIQVEDAAGGGLSMPDPGESGALSEAETVGALSESAHEEM